MITIMSLAAFAAGLFLFIILQQIYFKGKIISLKKKIREPELIQYIDTSGVDSIPPKHIDVWQGKTLNIKLGKWDIIIPMVRSADFFKYVETISRNYQAVRHMAENPKNGNKLLESMLFVQLHNKNTILIYKLSRNFVKDKRKFKNALIRESRENIAFIVGVCEQVLDFWALYKKKISLLSLGLTERQTGGEHFAQSLSGSDGDGMTYAMPRYALYSSTAVH